MEWEGENLANLVSDISAEVSEHGDGFLLTISHSGMFAADSVSRMSF